MNVAVLLATVAVATATALVLENNRDRIQGEFAVVAAPVSGGLVGIRKGDPEIKPYFNGDTLEEGRWRVTRSRSYFWSPAISTGIIFRASDHERSVSGGIGLHFVAFGENEDTRYAPAITLHYGTEQRQGWVPKPR
ncbi:MAG: hypothetical protein IPK72_17765 [Candidatus Eisenbacteria bacterium]|nr:hypothetical protein [Candidatus Eisenbacteria bacterium]